MMSPPMNRSPTSPAPVEPRHCIKCGREIGPDESICETCNRAGMATPSASQYHGTVVVAIVLAVVALAVAASLSLRGVGPYAAEVREVTDRRPVGYEVTYAVTNEGTSAGRAKCQLIAVSATGQRLRTRNTVTDQIAGGASVEASATLPDLDDEPAAVTVTCS
jgi:predicted nucleic acid-binding Zn ribbon protein